LKIGRKYIRIFQIKFFLDFECLSDKIKIMEARRSERKIVSIPAEVIYNHKRCASFIENISEHGLYLVTAPSDTSIEFTPESPVEVKFELPEGKKVTLNCIIKWTYKTPPHGITESMGVEVIDPPPLFKEIFRSIN